MDLTTGAVTLLDTPAVPERIAIHEARVFWTSIGMGDDNTRGRDGTECVQTEVKLMPGRTAAPG